MYAFVYAVGDSRHPGEVKIGCTSGPSYEEARSKTTSRYKSVYRHLRVYKFIPVELPKRDAERVIKRYLVESRHDGELYDLPCVDADATGRYLDDLYAGLEAPMEAAHFVIKDDGGLQERRQELKRQRLEAVGREEERVALKRQRTAERVVADEQREERQLRRARTVEQAAGNDALLDHDPNALRAWVQQHLAVGTEGDHVLHRDVRARMTGAGVGHQLGVRQLKRYMQGVFRGTSVTWRRDLTCERERVAAWLQLKWL